MCMHKVPVCFMHDAFFIYLFFKGLENIFLSFFLPPTSLHFRGSLKKADAGRISTSTSNEMTPVLYKKNTLLSLSVL